MIRVIIADDHHLVRQGIRMILERAEDIQVVAEAEDGSQAVDLVRQHQPDVLVTDMAMPRLNGIQAMQQLKAARLPTRIIVLSMYSDITLVQQSLQEGAVGYLLKSSVSEELLIAVRAAMRGETYLNPEIARQVIESSFSGELATAAQNPLDRLTPREVEVLKLVAEGHTNREIAHELNISTKTVEKHRANLMEKLDLHDLTGLIRFALKNHLIVLEE